MLKPFRKRNTDVHAVRFEGGQENALAISKAVGGGRYIPPTATDPRNYLEVPTMFGPRDVPIGDWIVKIGDQDQVVYKNEAFVSEYAPIEDAEKPLIMHARAELALFPNEDPSFIESIMETIKGFCSYDGHSGSSAAIAIHMVTALLNGQNLLPLTNDPEEWELRRGDDYGLDYDMWQNKRNSSAMSKDGGATYYLVSDGANTDETVKWYVSEAHDYVPEIEEEEEAPDGSDLS